MRDLNQEQVAIVFISGSAENWIGFAYTGISSTKEVQDQSYFFIQDALKSVQENNMCYEFINQKNTRIDVISLVDIFLKK